MTTIKRAATVPYAPSQMFQLVNAIEDYPHFIPWCKSTRVLSRSEDEIQATLDFAQGAIHKSFTTLNRLQENKIIEIRLIHGPFRHLEGFWQFEPLAEGGCRVSLDLEFEFSSRLLSLAVGPFFQKATNMLVELFCKRAHQVYGS